MFIFWPQNCCVICFTSGIFRRASWISMKINLWEYFLTPSYPNTNMNCLESNLYISNMKLASKYIDSYLGGHLGFKNKAIRTSQADNCKLHFWSRCGFPKIWSCPVGYLNGHHESRARGGGHFHCNVPQTHEKEEQRVWFSGVSNMTNITFPNLFTFAESIIL